MTTRVPTEAEVGEPLDCAVVRCGAMTDDAPYSTDIAAAWRLYERLRSAGVDILIMDPGTDHGGCVEISMYVPLDDDGPTWTVEVEAIGKTVMEAICRAALDVQDCTEPPLFPLEADRS